MNFPTIKRLCICLSAAMAATGAQAVHISPNGTGQVLLFPYYTVRNGFATLVSVTNTQNNTKIMKVRFLEGMNGRDVKSFNLFLAPEDTWTGVVVGTADGAKIITNDNSCIAPSEFFTETQKTPSGQTFNEFSNLSFTGSLQDAPAFSTLDRTREGYFEIIEMGVIDATLSATAAQIVGYAKPADPERSSTTNCAALDSFDGIEVNPLGFRFPNTGGALMAPPRGGLKGRASLINAVTGANYSFSPTVLDGWSSQVAFSSSAAARGTLLSEAFPSTSMVTTPAGIVIATWANGRDAVSATLMRESLANEFVLDSGTASQTDWLLTFPTKPFYTDPIYGNTNANFRVPFSGIFSATGTTGCDPYGASVSNRDGNRKTFFFGVRPPAPLESGAPELCRIANIVPFLTTTPSGAFGVSSLVGSPTLSPVGYYGFYLYTASSNSTASALTSPAFKGTTQGPNGRATLFFNMAPQQLTPRSAILIAPSGAQTTIIGNHFGLPVIGMMLHNYQNANVVSRYGGVIEHGYSVRVE